MQIINTLVPILKFANYRFTRIHQDYLTTIGQTTLIDVFFEENYLCFDSNFNKVVPKGPIANDLALDERLP